MHATMLFWPTVLTSSAMAVEARLGHANRQLNGLGLTRLWNVSGTSNVDFSAGYS
jgi:hypothetical protein